MKFYIFVQRNVIIGLDENIKIWITRIFCKVNYEERTKTGKALQYTITILPGLLVPHSRIPVNAIFFAYTEYVHLRKYKTQYAAAFAIGCHSRHSFRLYFVRMTRRLLSWTNVLLPKKEKLEILPEVPLKDQWDSLVGMMINRMYSPVDSNWQGMAHILFCAHGMGLGP